MIDTPLEIFLAGALAGAFPTFLLLLLIAGRDLERLEGRVRRLRSALRIIAVLDSGPAAESARNALEVDDRG